MNKVIKDMADDMIASDMVEYDFLVNDDIDEEGNIYYGEPDVSINYYKTAQNLVKAGYGHIPTAIGEFAEEIVEMLEDSIHDSDNIDNKNLFYATIICVEEIATKYGVDRKHNIIEILNKRCER